jgi:hypothetical protein
MRFWNIVGWWWVASLWLFWICDVGEIATGVTAILALQCFIADEVLETMRKRDSILKGARETA